MQKEEQETYGKKRYYNSISGKISIEERPKIAENRRRYGDWDADTIIGRQGGAVLVTLGQGYFAHPFCSGERGLNENTNGLIRQYLPKKTSFDDLTKGGVQWIIDKLNNRARKTLDGKTPHEVFFSGKRIALGS